MRGPPALHRSILLMLPRNRSASSPMHRNSMQVHIPLSSLKTHILAATLLVAVTEGINSAHAGEPANTAGTRADAAPKREIRLERVTPEYWRVTFDNPPFNLFGPESIPQLNSVITQMESDSQVKVVVFQSAVPGFFLTHYDFVPPLSATTDIPPGVTGLPALPDILVRLSRATVVSIVSIPA